MSDIVDRIRSVETTPLHRTDQWVELWKVLQDARTEIELLRSNTSEQPNSSLTDAEREALWFAIAYAQNGGSANAESALRGLLERLG